MSDRRKWLYELDHEFRMVVRRFRQELKGLIPEDMTSNEFFYLKMLNKEGPQRVSSLSREFGVTASLTTAVLDRLVQKGYVIRQRSDRDRRIVEVALTSEGRKRIDELEKNATEHMIRKFEPLTDEEIRTLIELLRKIT